MGMMYLYIERAHARKVILGVKSSVQLKLCIYNCTVYIVKCIYNCVTTVHSGEKYPEFPD